ncbi:hypothetical protein [Streptomyces sp. NPDC003077]|uniref:hypothetical protein n=1 Tax=Streptomyces sp. NPDC003077 TaxID=3154443 RepID=UPI0033B02EA2
MVAEYWYAYVLAHLEPVLRVCREVYERNTEGGTVWPAVDGMLEWTLPWGMDDGEGLVRLSVVEERGRGDGVPRARVAVAAKAEPFAFGRPTTVPLPRYRPEDSQVVRVAGEAAAEPAPRPGSALRPEPPHQPEPAPRPEPPHQPAPTPRPDPDLTRRMARALLEGVGGEPESWREEPGGECSFAVRLRG